DMGLRFTTKFADTSTLEAAAHGGRTRARFSVNAAAVERFEGGTARVRARLDALRRMAEAGYPVGLTIAPIMPVEHWREEYDALLQDAADAVEHVVDLDLTVELITHRFTEGSKRVLAQWYPGSRLDMDEASRSRKLTKFGSVKWVFPRDAMKALRGALEAAVARRLPGARILYWT
ncbi:MAG TPA: hypothetical protein VEX11_13830, partial [Acetobacteraceae bacterium]|nr:hypothetical protein [Acetobacteraceae bacterium]